MPVNIMVIHDWYFHVVELEKMILKAFSKL